jgi:hypothetical protein
MKFARCAFFDRNMHSRNVPLGCSCLLPVVTVNCIQTLKDFDNSRCPAEIKRTKAGYLGIIRVAEIEVMGYPQSTSTTVTTKTKTTTTSTNTAVAALHNRIDDLLSNQVDSGNVR